MNESGLCSEALGMLSMFNVEHPEIDAEHKLFMQKALKADLDAIDKFFFTPVEDTDNPREFIIKRANDEGR